jgi:hypothetical protein
MALAREQLTTKVGN